MNKRNQKNNEEDDDNDDGGHDKGRRDRLDSPEASLHW